MSEIAALPSNVYAERVVLGVLMQRGDLYPTIRDVLKSEDFSLDRNRATYRLMDSLFVRGEAIDAATLSGELLRLHPDGEAPGGLNLTALAELFGDIPEVPNLSSYVRLVREASARRKLILSAHALQQKAADAQFDLADVAEEFQRTVQDAAGALSRHEPLTIGEIIDREGGINRIVDRSTVGSVPFPWGGLQHRTGGMQPGEVVVIAAETGGGKSAFLGSLLQGICRKGYGALLFSLEMTGVSLVHRQIAVAAAVNSRVFRHGDAPPEALESILRGASEIADMPLLIDDRGSLSVPELIGTARRVRNKRRLDVLAVDYLQLMGGKGMSAAERIEGISRGLKVASMELRIPVIALAQFSRPPKGVTPQRSLQDLHGSSAIEKDASMVFFLEGESPEAMDPMGWLPWRLRCKKMRDGGYAGWAADFQWQKATGIFHETTERREGF